MSRPLATRAPAKINLSLHVLGRRADGYHNVESLVAFAGTGDALSLEPGSVLRLIADGPRAALLGDGSDNLVMKAARSLVELRPGLKVGTFRLTKRLPVAAGIGGGSSDAAAALRLLARLNGLPLSAPEILDAARSTGADVLVCLEARARMMGGIGEILGPVMRLPPLFAVLVNSGTPVATPDVFRALGLRQGEIRAAPTQNQWPTASGLDFIAALRDARNDLEPPARRVQPGIIDVLRKLSASEGCRLARMSGSGATVFGLFDDCVAAAAAARKLQAGHPDWWVKPTVLR
jgi:4-diphosphocytidyl-2-C-methyl-D-erythritol kinase